MNLIKIHIKFPISKAKLLKEYGDIPVSYLWEDDELILLRDLLKFVEVENFKSELELKNAIRKAYKRYRMS